MIRNDPQVNDNQYTILDSIPYPAYTPYVVFRIELTEDVSLQHFPAA